MGPLLERVTALLQTMPPVRTKLRCRIRSIRRTFGPAGAGAGVSVSASASEGAALVQAPDRRRRLLLAGFGGAVSRRLPGAGGPALAAGLATGLAACQRESLPALSGHFVGPDLVRGHRLREPLRPESARSPESAGGAKSASGSESASGSDSARGPSSAGTAETAAGRGRAAGTEPDRRIRVAIVGGGVAGLAAARLLAKAGVADYHLFELDSSLGGNARGGAIGGMACPWGAHYLPAPSLAPRNEVEAALVDMLREFGVIVAGGSEPGAAPWRYAESILCQAPQERVLVGGQWQSGLLPIERVTPRTLEQYRRFSRAVQAEQAAGRYGIPAPPPRSGDEPAQRLERTGFAAWLDQHSFDDPNLRWYLDYCCRDDYGAPSAEVSAWAGLHYFASRHGFEAPSNIELSGAGEPAQAPIESPAEVLTWPQGNQWLIDRMAGPHAGRTSVDAMLVGLDHDPRGLRPSMLEVWLASEQRVQRWRADFVILAVPLNVAARVLRPLPAPLAALLPSLRYSAWQVANLHLSSMPDELPGAPLSWDNVLFDSDWLGFVDAGHQLLRSHRSQSVFTSYRALGTDPSARRSLLSRSWRDQADEVIALFRRAYPRIERHMAGLDIVRWGHPMLAPTPGLRAHPGLAALREPQGHVVLAHSDLAGYSVFEEAFAAGERAARFVIRKLAG